MGYKIFNAVEQTGNKGDLCYDGEFGMFIKKYHFRKGIKIETQHFPKEYNSSFKNSVINYLRDNNIIIPQVYNI